MEQNSKSPESFNPKLTRRQFLQLAGSTLALATTGCEIDINNLGLFQEQSGLIVPAQYERQPLVEKIKGVNLPSWYKGEYQMMSSVQSFDNLRELYPNLIGVIPTRYQETINSTNIISTDNTATDEDLKYMIQQAHLFGYQVMLKPHLVLSKDPAHWHGQIGTHFTEEQKAAWFRSYQEMINHYAKIAEETGVELMVMANESRHLAIHAGPQWAETIDEIKKIYSGPLTYAAHMEDFEQMTWWSKLDFLGLNPYFSLSQKLTPSLSELQSTWKGIATRIEKAVKRLDKPVIFPEIGYPSVKGAARQPYNFNMINKATVDLQQQANCYQAMYEAVWNKDWMKGIVIWDWNIDPSIGGLKNGDYTVKGKPAAKIITKYHLN